MSVAHPLQSEHHCQIISNNSMWQQRNRWTCREYTNSIDTRTISYRNIFLDTLGVYRYSMPCDTLFDSFALTLTLPLFLYSNMCSIAAACGILQQRILSALYATCHFLIEYIKLNDTRANRDFSESLPSTRLLMKEKIHIWNKYPWKNGS